MASVEGTVYIEAVGKTHPLRYSTRALARIESEFAPQKIQEVLNEMRSGMDVALMIKLFWCGLPADLTKEDALDISDEIGPARTGVLIGEAFQAAFPTSEADVTGEDPPKAASATGSAG